MARFPNYSLRNVCLIQAQFPGATQVAGFRTWSKLGRWVKKGQKGIAIYAPIFRTKEPIADEMLQSESEPIGYRAVHVFDISQTQGEDLPNFAEVKGDAAESLARLKDLVSERGIELRYVEDMEALGVSKAGTILLRAGLSPANEFATLAHELAHELLHQNSERGPLSKSIKETEAEAVAFVLCEAVGLSTNSACSDYIQLHQGNEELLKNSLAIIHQTANLILQAILPEV